MEIPQKVAEIAQQMVNLGWNNTQHIIMFTEKFDKIRFARNGGWVNLSNDTACLPCGDACAQGMRYQEGTTRYHHAIHLITDGTKEFEEATAPFYNTLKEHTVGLWEEIPGVPGTLATLNVPDKAGDDVGRLVLSLRSTKEHSTYRGFNALIAAGVDPIMALHLSITYQYDPTYDSWVDKISHGPMACFYLDPLRLIHFVNKGGSVFKLGTTDPDSVWGYGKWDDQHFKGVVLRNHPSFPTTLVKASFGNASCLTTTTLVDVINKVKAGKL